MIRCVLILVAMLATPLAFAEDISGFWKHSEEPGWIEISLDEGKGTVIRNDKFPERVGREILKDLRADDSEQGLWLTPRGWASTRMPKLPCPSRTAWRSRLSWAL